MESMLEYDIHSSAATQLQAVNGKHSNGVHLNGTSVHADLLNGKQTSGKHVTLVKPSMPPKRTIAMTPSPRKTTNSTEATSPLNLSKPIVFPKTVKSSKPSVFTKTATSSKPAVFPKPVTSPKMVNSPVVSLPLNYTPEDSTPSTSTSPPKSPPPKPPRVFDEPEESTSLKASKFCQFEVFYKNEDAVKLGDIVHGWMEINTCRRACITSMCVTFYGQVEYRVHNIGTRKRHVKRHMFERFTQELWHHTKAGAKAKLMPGFYVYEFFVGTRMDLPNSFTSKRGLINNLTYFCEVDVTETLASGERVRHITSKPIHLVTSPDAVPTLIEKIRHKPVVYRGATFVRNLLDMSGCVICTVTLANQQCQPDHNVIYNVQILNCFRHITVTVSLEQSARLADEEHVITHTLYELKLGCVKAKQPTKQWLGERIWIPAKAMSEADVRKVYAGRKLVYLGYAIMVHVKPTLSKSMTIRVPLVIRDNCMVTGHRFPNGLLLSGAATL